MKPIYLSGVKFRLVPKELLNFRKFSSVQSIISICIAVFLFQFINGCAPYSIPEKKSYSEKDDPYTYYLQSVEAYNDQNLPLALDYINQAILLNKDMAKFYQLKGEIYRAQFDYTQALLAFNQALKKRSNFIAVHESIGEMYQAQDQNDEAIRAYKRVTGLEPQRIDIILRIVECYIALNELEVAQHNLDIYERSALEYNIPLEDGYYLLRADILFRRKKFEESITYLQNIRKPTQKSITLQGLDYYGLGNYETGVSYFNKLLALDKENGKWYFYRGLYYFQKNDFNDAQSQFKHALVLDPKLTQTRYYLGKIHLANGDKSSALEEFNKYLKEDVGSEYFDEVNKIITTLNQK